MSRTFSWSGISSYTGLRSPSHQPKKGFDFWVINDPVSIGKGRSNLVAECGTTQPFLLWELVNGSECRQQLRKDVERPARMELLVLEQFEEVLTEIDNGRCRKAINSGDETVTQCHCCLAGYGRVLEHADAAKTEGGPMFISLIPVLAHCNHPNVRSSGSEKT